MSRGRDLPALSAVDHDPFADAPLARVAPTTEAQREVWLAAQFSPQASLAYNESVSLRLRGRLDVAALDAALQDLVARHEALRAVAGADGQTLQILEALQVAVPIQDLRGSTTGERELALTAVLRRAVTTPFDLTVGPLVRAELLAIADDDHLLVLTAHHIVCDGWSFGVIVEDLATLYAGRLRRTAPKLPAAASFVDYSIAQHVRTSTAEHAADEAFWLSQFAGEPPVLDLPTDRPRGNSRSFDSRRVDHALDGALVAALRQLAARSGVSLFSAMLAGFVALLHRLAAPTDLVIGVPSAGQSVDDRPGLVGHCVNLLPVRLAVDADAPLPALMMHSQTALLDAFDHARYTYGALLKKLVIARDPSRPPLVSVMFNLDQALDPNAPGFPDLVAQFEGNARAFENFELFVNAVQTGDGIRLECQFGVALFDDETVGRWLECYESLLRAACARPDTALGQLEIEGAADRQCLSAWNRTRHEYRRDVLVHGLFEEQVARAAQRTAVVMGERRLSYGELDQQANQVAHALRAMGVRAGALVGLHLERGLPMLAALLGVLKARAAYVPMDPSYPMERLRFMAEDAELQVLVSQRSLQDALPWPRERLLLMDDDAGALQRQPVTAPPREEGALDIEQPAYVIYTSGSTGRPKGVRVPHRAVLNYLQSIEREPGLHAEDRLLAVTTLSFDIAVTELLGPLCVGAQIVLASREQAVDGVLLRGLIESHRATLMQATPSTWQLLLQSGWQAEAGFRAWCGGEALSADLAQRLLQAGAQLWNLYGPTETTVWSTCARIDSVQQGISIGRPIANTTVWILDDRLQPCPIGVPGEICIGGEGVTLGYLKRPELTAERFIASPFDASPGALLYRTGDRGRWRNDGQLEHLGRNDFQVKIRGHRIELGEIEAALLQQPGVATAVAVAREDQPGDVRLVAYAVAEPGSTLDTALLQQALATMLPQYMRPQHLIPLPTLPLLPNGKIDRKALPVPTAPMRATSDWIGPRTPTETRVLAAMESVLGLPGLGVRDSFFRLGGHSLLAARLAMRLSRECNVAVPLRIVFDAPTAESLALWIDGQAGPARTDAAVIPRLADRHRAPLSPMQERLWVVEQMHPGRAVYNEPSGHRLIGPMDEAAFEAAFREMLRRQDALRTIFAVEDGMPLQRVLDNVELSLFPAQDLSGLDAAQRERIVADEMRRMATEPFDLLRGPLVRTHLFRLGSREHVLFLMVHHILWDGWSIDVFYEEMSALYAAFAARRPSPLPELAVSFGDFAAWQRSASHQAELAKQVAHWKAVLEGPIEPLDLPLDKPRPAVQSGEGDSVWIDIPRPTADALRELGQGADCTLYMVLLALHAVLLNRHTGQRELVIGTPVRGRPLPELERLMGFFVNTLPLRIRIDPDQSFVALLAHVRMVVLDAFQSPDVPFEQLVRELKAPRDESRFPIFQTVFSFQEGRGRPSTWGALQHRPNFVQRSMSAWDLGLWFLEREEGLRGGLVFSTDILTRTTAERLRDRYARLIEQVVGDSTLPLSQLTAITSVEATQIRAFNLTSRTYDANPHLGELIRRQVLANPDSVAVLFEDRQWSYRELDSAARVLSARLRDCGVGPGARVGVCMQRSMELVTALLGVVYSGAAYVPLDPEYPEERRRGMCEDAEVAAVLTMPDRTASALGLPEALPLLVVSLAANEVLGEQDFSPRGSPDDAAYVIFTSGSTGRPKGAVNSHRGVVNRLLWMQQEYQLQARDRVMQKTPYSFDVSVWEFFWPLMAGASIVLARPDGHRDSRYLVDLIRRAGVTHMHFVPSMLRAFLDNEDAIHCNGLKRVVCSGEALPPDLVGAFFDQFPNTRLSNLYGPTEAAVDVTFWECSPADANATSVPIGRPAANTSIYVLDERLQPVPIGVRGDIYIAGVQVGMGYVNRPELTAERFVPDPFVLGGRMYKTGDLGRWRNDGAVEYFGRSDDQVKIRGNRIEPGEIEACLATHPDVRESVVVVRQESAGGDARLVAYVVVGQDMDIVTALRQHLRKTLPEYMLPQQFVPMERMPLLPNGKINRKALPVPSSSAMNKPRQIAPRSPGEREIARIWQDLLHLDRVGITDNFFDLGGHSLLAIQAIARIEAELGARVSMHALVFETLAQLAAGLKPIAATERREAFKVPRWLGRWIRGSVH